MPTKIFISFLGARPYHDTQYFWQPNRADLSAPIPYVQEAIIRNCLPAWSEGDKIFIFTTEEAKRNNYDSQITSFDSLTNTPRLQENKGLNSVLEKLKVEGIINYFEPVIIPNGYTEQEIFQVFQQVFERIETNSEVYLDITVGFRSLPMLGIVLLNYAKNVIDAEVKAIYYGNYEAGIAEKEEQVNNAKYKRLSENDIEKVKRATVQTPILNLISLSILQDWTSAAREFIKLGKAESLAGLVEESQPKLAQQLLQLEESIATCRGKLLTQDLDLNGLKNTLLLSKNEPIKEQLKPLISKIENKINAFENGNTLKNGFAAVEWCIQHNMIQQGITFLQETLISHMVEKHVGNEKINELFYREIAATSLMLFSKKGNRHFAGGFMKRAEQEQKDILIIYDNMREYVKNNAPLKLHFSELTGNEGFRNDINHCGFRKNYQTPNELKTSLFDLFQNIKSLNLN
jgi:CRISPR-associated DxTHG motif protein